MKIRILHASVNPELYDVKKLASMGYSEAQEFFENDTICCCNWGIDDINPVVFNCKLYSPDGATGGNGSDALFVWFKLVPWQ